MKGTDEIELIVGKSLLSLEETGVNRVTHGRGGLPLRLAARLAARHSIEPVSEELLDKESAAAADLERRAALRGPVLGQRPPVIPAQHRRVLRERHRALGVQRLEHLVR